ncbi:hypothetical protein [Streptacidiphilus melanogenes]|uniref:hypothetical protein n=1 Tax=Streptacidiphilus melanogenes TaxID=411235 RepID=UPI00126A2245|nr:hypothetical protein [Streptacidiphilus melanogenes]
MAVMTAGAVLTGSGTPAHAAQSASIKVACGDAKKLVSAFKTANKQSTATIVLNPNKNANCTYALSNLWNGLNAGVALVSRGKNTVVQGNGAVLTLAPKADARVLIKVNAGVTTLRNLVLAPGSANEALWVKSGKTVLAGNTEARGGDYLPIESGATLEMGDTSSVHGHHTHGIYNQGGTLVMSGRSRVYDNHAGPGTDGGGVWNLGTMTMKDHASISGNSVQGQTGLDQGGNYGNGGGVNNKGTLTVQDQATITDNTATPRTTGGMGGGIYNSSTTTVPTGSVTGNKPTQCDGPKPVTGCTT